MSLQYDVDFSMGKIDGLLKELEVEVTKSVGKGVAQGMENSQRNASKRGAAVGSEFKKGIQGGMGDLGISQATTKAGAQSTGAARTAGSGLGAAFGAMFSATALTSMGNSLMMGTGNLIARSYSLASDRLKSQVGLNQAISISNKRNTALNSTLKDSTKTIEDKAIALGIDTKKLYTNAKAGGASIAVGEDLEKTIKSQKRALEDLTFGKEQDLNILERQLKKLKEENEARLKLARTLKGADRLEDSNKALEAQIDTLKLQENELETNGLSTSAIKLQIEELNRKKETNDLLLNQVERETESIKTQGKALEDDLLARIEAIKAEISDANNRFELDTREATQKLEELKSLASSVSVGGGSEQQVLDPKAQQYIDALSEQSVEPTQFTDADRDTVKQELLGKFGKVVDESAINKLLTDLILGGLVESGDTATLTKLSSQLIDTAAIILFFISLPVNL
jgi:DNA repair exonuclease SbcCD ATPase subunit